MGQHRTWSPWWSVLSAVLALVSLLPVLVISLVWRAVGVDDLGVIGMLLGLAGTVGLVVVGVLTAAWAAFLVLRRRTVFVAAAVLTLSWWGWVLLG